ncbi:DNA-binding response regulator [Flavobacterium sp. LC2016-23]|uniref:response regulator transcription factor n=1 Tax=Flavobacterium sp. LC2016-23 TaxID=2666330 RepID=UPI0012AF59B3|nr:LuxR C-terminal-related transcriptional regulator [Flavobacterium sp. LC2016-23]MRX40606.1 DNA-binding response regulator [Flavobacterium sp. LC2016-23]
MESKSTIKNEIHQIPAGLLLGDNRTEIFGDRETKKSFFVSNGQTFTFKELEPLKKAQIFKQLLNDDVALEDLKDLNHEEATEQFAFCIYGAADHIADFNELGQLNKADNFICSNNCNCLKWKSKSINIDGNALTVREIEIVNLMASDLPDKRIADELKIAKSTLNTHKQNLFEKAGVKSKSGLITKAINQKIIQ